MVGETGKVISTGRSVGGWEFSRPFLLVSDHGSIVSMGVEVGLRY